MNDNFLSQDEIDALLKGGSSNDSPAESPAASPDSAEKVTDMEKDALGEIGNISMGSAATTLSVLLGRRVSITTPRVSLDTLISIKDQYPLPYLIVEVGYTHGIEGNNILAIHEKDALIIADLMMGGDGTNPPTELNELYMSAVGEAMNQMMGSVSTSMSTMFNKKIDISPPKVNLIDLSTEEPVTDILNVKDVIVKVAFRMEVEGLIDSEIMQILPLKIAKEMVESLMSGSMGAEPEPEAPQVAVAPPVPPVQQAQQPQAPTMAPQQQPMYAMPPQQQMYAMPPQQQMYAQQDNHIISNVPVQSAQFAPLTPGVMPGVDGNIGLIMDVPLQVTVELGRTKKLIKDVLELSSGSIIELDKLAGEPVDVFVNGKLLAKGEVVVIDENFGVRITDIVSMAERAKTIQ